MQSLPTHATVGAHLPLLTHHSRCHAALHCCAICQSGHQRERRWVICPRQVIDQRQMHLRWRLRAKTRAVEQAPAAWGLLFARW